MVSPTWSFPSSHLYSVDSPIFTGVLVDDLVPTTAGGLEQVVVE